MIGGGKDRAASDFAVCLTENCNAAPLFDPATVFVSIFLIGFALALALVLTFVLLTGRIVDFAILFFAGFTARFAGLFLFDLFLFLVAIGGHPIFSRIA